MKRLFPVVCVLLACLLSGPAVAALGTNTVSEIDRLSGAFTNELAKYDRALDDAVAALRDQYSVALVALERKFTGAGALDSVLAVRKESARFTTDRALRTSDLVDEPAELYALQQQYIRKFAALPCERAGKVVRLADLYVKSLRGLEESLTKRRMLDDAIEVKRLREAVPALPAVAGANLIVSTTPAEQAPATNPASPGIKAPSADHGVTKSGLPQVGRQTAKKKYTGSSAGRIRDQFEVFAKSVRRQNWEAAAAIVDPSHVKANGTKRAEDFVRRFAGPFRNENDAPHMKIDLRGVEVDGDDRGASGVPRISNFGFTRDLSPLRWVQTDGDWYIDVHETLAERRDERGGRGR